MRSERQSRRWLVVLVVVVLLVAAGAVLASVLGGGTKPATPRAGATGSSAAPSGGPRSGGGGSAAPPRSGTTTLAAITSPVFHGGTETVEGLAAPGAQCSLSITGAGGPVNPPGLALSMKTNTQGRVTWSWKVDAGYRSGDYALKLVCSPGATSTSSFTVS